MNLPRNTFRFTNQNPCINTNMCMEKTEAVLNATNLDIKE